MVGSADSRVHDLAKCRETRFPAARRAKTPNCTHVRMNRVYGRDQQCFVCGRVPSMGFLYVCCQDDMLSPSVSDSLRGDEDGTVERHMGLKSQLRQELEEFGLSESVILTAERGDYTPAQLVKLKALKLELKQAIEDVIQGTQINKTVAKLALSAKGPSNNDRASHRSSKTDTFIPTYCHFKACHTCRPYYKDRVYVSFQSVLSNNFSPVTASDAAILPIKPASMLRFVGLLPNPMVSGDYPSVSPLPTGLSTTSARALSRASVMTFETTQTDVDALSTIRQPRRRFYNLGQRSSQEIAYDLVKLPNLLTRQGLKSAIQGIFRPSRESSSSGSNITLPLPRTGTVRDRSRGSPVREFDVGTLRRVRRQKERNEVQNGTYVGGFEGVGSALQPRTEQAVAVVDHETPEHDEEGSDSNSRVYSCVSEGNEVEVDGGVALTEEAVETHIPDVLTTELVYVSQEKKQDIIGVEECIMSQV